MLKPQVEGKKNAPYPWFPTLLKSVMATKHIINLILDDDGIQRNFE